MPVGERFIEQFNYQDSNWTTLHRSVQLQVQPGGIEEENEMSLPQHLWNDSVLKLHVYDEINLSQEIPTKIRIACSRCGRVSHSVSNCFARTIANGEGLESSDYESVFVNGAPQSPDYISHIENF